MLRKQAEKAVLGIKLLGSKCNDLPRDLAFQLFDSKVLPILCYGSEIWGTKIWSEIEIVHNQFCKNADKKWGHRQNNNISSKAHTKIKFDFLLLLEHIKSFRMYLSIIVQNLKIIGHWMSTPWAAV